MLSSSFESSSSWSRLLATTNGEASSKLEIVNGVDTSVEEKETTPTTTEPEMVTEETSPEEEDQDPQVALDEKYMRIAIETALEA
jgi:hypothetical protein